MTIDEIFNTYENKIKLKSSPPEWLASINKSGLTRNITIQDWNSVIEDISHIASDCNTIDEFIRAYKEYVKTEFDNMRAEANTTYTLLEEKINTKSSTYFYENTYKMFEEIATFYSGEQKFKKGDIIGITERYVPDYMVLDSLADVGDRYVLTIPKQDMENGNYPVYDSEYYEGDIVAFEGLDIYIMAIEDGQQIPSTDTMLTKYSTNPVQNKVITLALQELENKIDVSGNITVEQEVNNSTNPVSSKAVMNEFGRFSEVYDEIIDNVEKVAKGATRSVAYSSYADMVEIVNIMSANEFKVGDHILIRAMNVPDLWVYSVLPNPFHYSFVDDEAFINELSDIGVTVGHFVLAPLETQKVALNDYVTNDTFNDTVSQTKEELEIKYKTLENSPEPIPLENNTVYIAQTPITKLYVDLPTDNNYICSLTFEVGEDYDIRLYRDDGEIMYLKPLDFESGELWEINIMNNIVASGKVSGKVVSE